MATLREEDASKRDSTASDDEAKAVRSLSGLVVGATLPQRLLTSLCLQAAVEQSGPSWNLLNIKLGRAASGKLDVRPCTAHPTPCRRWPHARHCLVLQGTVLQSPGVSFRKHRHKKPAKAATTKAVKAVKDKGVNLRDVGATTKDQVKPGALFRSSELLG